MSTDPMEDGSGDSRDESESARSDSLQTTTSDSDSSSGRDTSAEIPSTELKDDDEAPDTDSLVNGYRHSESDSVAFYGLDHAARSESKNELSFEPPEEQTPEACIHYVRAKQLPYHLRKYFVQRYDIFSRYDEGILFTQDAWYGVTPEPVAEYAQIKTCRTDQRLTVPSEIAKQVAASANANKTILIDMFAGVGGNTIAFAKSGRWDHIYAIEKDYDVLYCASFNAQIYGVADRITFIHGDCMEVVNSHIAALERVAVVFASPPWGGVTYQLNPVFDLMTMEPYNLLQLYTPLSQISKDIVLYLPRTSDLDQLSNLAKLTDPKKFLPVFSYSICGHKKAICAFFGNFTFESIPAADIT